MISRSEAIKKIMEKTGPEDLVLSTTGMISREVFSHNDRHQNFYMIGSMGLALIIFGVILLNLFGKVK